MKKYKVTFIGLKGQVSFTKEAGKSYQAQAEAAAELPDYFVVKRVTVAEVKENEESN